LPDVSGPKQCFPAGATARTVDNYRIDTTRERGYVPFPDRSTVCVAGLPPVGVLVIESVANLVARAPGVKSSMIVQLAAGAKVLGATGQVVD